MGWLIEWVRRIFGKARARDPQTAIREWEYRYDNSRLKLERLQVNLRSLETHAGKTKSDAEEAAAQGTPSHILSDLTFKAREAQKDLDSAVSEVQSLRDNVRMLGEMVRMKKEEVAMGVKVNLADFDVQARTLYEMIMEHERAVEKYQATISVVDMARQQQTERRSAELDEDLRELNLDIPQQDREEDQARQSDEGPVLER